VDAGGRPDTWEIDGVAVPLLWSASGPQVRSVGRAGEQALGFFVLVAVGRPDVIAALDSRVELITPCAQESPYAWHVTALEAEIAQPWHSPAEREGERAAVVAAAQRWRQWGGESPGADAYLLGVPWGRYGDDRYADVVVPRRFLRSLLTLMARPASPPHVTLW